MQHQLQHAKLLLPEHKTDFDELLRSTARLNATITDPRVRVLEVQRTRRNQLQPAQQAVTSAFNRLNLLALPPARPSKSAEGDAPEEPKRLEAPPPLHVSKSLAALGVRTSTAATTSTLSLPPLVDRPPLAALGDRPLPAQPPPPPPAAADSPKTPRAAALPAAAAGAAIDAVGGDAAGAMDVRGDVLPSPDRASPPPAPPGVVHFAAAKPPGDFSSGADQGP